MKWSFRIATIAGTAVKVHVTFVALLVFLAGTDYFARGVGAALTGTLFILAVFACVLAHEFGHILMARRFGVRTPDVILLPIGGLARLERIQQLGFVSRVWPGARHTRFEHSLGVMHLTRLAIAHLRATPEGRWLSDEDARVAVAAGLLVSLFLWRSGPLGALGLLFTPAAMVIAQALIATPLVAGLTAAALGGLDPRYRLQLAAMGAGPVRSAWMLLREARVPTIAAAVAAFGGVISEVGAAMMVGGNIKGQTRVLTTATVLEVGRGNFAAAITLSTVLLILVYTVVLVLTVLQSRR